MALLPPDYSQKNVLYKDIKSHMPKQKIVAVVLIVLSLVCLYPGLTQPMMNLTVAADLPLLGQLELYNQTQSIYQSIRSLFNSGNPLVAWLILLFSILIPVMKAVLLSLVLLLPNWLHRQRLQQSVAVISKWSMADVFVVGIFIAFLAGKAIPNIAAVLHSGFYWFSAYCIISIFSAQWVGFLFKNKA